MSAYWTKAWSDVLAEPPSTDPSEAALAMKAAVKAALEALFRSQEEFPIQVAGAHTTPYASVVAGLDVAQRGLLLRLIRPLPHELAVGAPFRMEFNAEKERYVATVVFRGREEYLRYRFDWPETLQRAERRVHKRYPFRPREKVFVVAQDGGFPGLGVAGPLANVSQGGLALRVDRIVRLDDGLRLHADTALFDRGRVFPIVCIQDLPGVPRVNARARVAHALCRPGGELFLAFEFIQMSDEDAQALSQALAIRENLVGGPSRGSALGGSGGHSVTAAQRPPRAIASSENEDAPLPPEEDEADAPPSEINILRRLARRTLRLGLAATPGPRQTGLADVLKAEGYARVELLNDLAAIRTATRREPALRRPELILVDLTLAGHSDEPLAALRVLEAENAEWNQVPILVFWEQDDPALRLGRGGLSLVCNEPGWLDVLDRKAKLAG